jgi:cysteine desulfurase
VPVALAVGFAAALRAAFEEREAFAARAASQQARLEAALTAMGGRVIGAEASRLPNTTAVVFPGLRGDLLVAALDLAGIAASAGSACASGSAKPAAILAAMGDPEPSGLLRLSAGPWTGDEEIERAARALGDAVRAAREVDLG